MAADPSVFDEADLNAFTDGRLEPARAAALAESLASDRQARHRIDGWKLQNDGIRTLFASVLFEPVPVRLLPTTLTGGNGLSKSPAPALQHAVESGFSPAAVVAMTTVGVALVGFMAGALATVATDGFGHAGWGLRVIESRSSADVSTLSSRAEESYRATLADPMRPTDLPAGDQARLQRWMSRQLSGTAHIPDLRAHGWSLLGGRVVPGQYGPAAFLIYGNGADRAGLYVAREPIPDAPRTMVSDDGAVSVTSWSEDGLGNAIALDQNGSRSDGVAETLRKAVRRQMRDDVTPP